MPHFLLRSRELAGVYAQLRSAFMAAPWAPRKVGNARACMSRALHCASVLGTKWHHRGCVLGVYNHQIQRPAKASSENRSALCRAVLLEIYPPNNNGNYPPMPPPPPPPPRAQAVGTQGKGPPLQQAACRSPITTTNFGVEGSS